MKEYFELRVHNKNTIEFCLDCEPIAIPWRKKNQQIVSRLFL